MVTAEALLLFEMFPVAPEALLKLPFPTVLFRTLIFLAKLALEVELLATEALADPEEFMTLEELVGTEAFVEKLVIAK